MPLRQPASSSAHDSEQAMQDPSADGSKADLLSEPGIAPHLVSSTPGGTEYQIMIKTLCYDQLMDPTFCMSFAKHMVHNFIVGSRGLTSAAPSKCVGRKPSICMMKFVCQVIPMTLVLIVASLQIILRTNGVLTSKSS